MTFIEKERQIIQTLNHTKYAAFGGLEDPTTKDDILGLIGLRLSSFPDYANAVVKEQIMTPLIYARMEGDELRDAIVRLDRERHVAHNRAMASIDGMNDMCARLKLEPYANIDTANRTAVADFVGRFVSEIYADGTGTSLDDVTSKRVEYDSTQNQARLRELDAKFGHIDQESSSYTVPKSEQDERAAWGEPDPWGYSGRVSREISDMSNR